MARKNKAQAVRTLLEEGLSAREIRDRMQVSTGYIYQTKKLMKTGVVSTPLELTEEMKPKPGEFIETDPSEFKEMAEERLEYLLNRRGTRYGSFIDQARISQRLKNVAHQFAAEQGKHFDVDQAEALDMIFAKIGRILNGDPNYADSWIDIAGYAKLVADRLEGKTR